MKSVFTEITKHEYCLIRKEVFLFSLYHHLILHRSADLQSKCDIECDLSAKQLETFIMSSGKILLTKHTRLSLGMVSTVMLVAVGTSLSRSSISANSTSIPSSTADLMVNSLRLWSQRFVRSLAQASCDLRYWRQRLMNCTAPGSEPTTPNSEVGGGWAGILAVTSSGEAGVCVGLELPLYGGMEGGGAMEELSPGPRVEYTR